MPNPYGIESVDIPGVYGAVQNARMGRIQAMLGERQIAAADRQADRENQFNQTLAGLFARPGATGQSGQPTTNPVVAAYGGQPPGPGAPAITPPGLPGANPTAPAAPSEQMPQIDPAVAARLLTLDPARAGPLITQIRAMNDEQIHRMTAANDYLARFGERLLTSGLPESQWAQEIQARAPDLLAHGIRPEQIQQFQANRQNVEYVVNQAQDVDHLVAAARPDLMVTPQGATVIDRNLVGRRDQSGAATNPVVYESPVVTGPNGEPYARPSGMSSLPSQVPPQPGEVRQTSRGPMRFRGGDYRDQNNYEPVQGGAGQQGPQTFP